MTLGYSSFLFMIPLSSNEVSNLISWNLSPYDIPLLYVHILLKVL